MYLSSTYHLSGITVCFCLSLIFIHISVTNITFLLSTWETLVYILEKVYSFPSKSIIHYSSKLNSYIGKTGFQTTKYIKSNILSSHQTSNYQTFWYIAFLFMLSNVFLAKSVSIIAKSFPRLILSVCIYKQIVYINNELHILII